METPRGSAPSLDGPDAEQVRAALRAVAHFADVFAARGFVAGETRAEPGVMPHFAPSAEVSAFAAAAYRAGLVFSFDWTEWTDEAARLSEDPEALAKIDLATVAKLLTTIIRQSRFIEGWGAGGRLEHWRRRVLAELHIRRQRRGSGPLGREEAEAATAEGQLRGLRSGGHRALRCVRS